MPKTIIAEGKTSTEAIEKGLKELKATRSQVDGKKLEEKKKSFFSILDPHVVKVELTIREDSIPEKKEKNIEKKEINQKDIEDANKAVENFLNNFLNKISSNIEDANKAVENFLNNFLNKISSNIEYTVKNENGLVYVNIKGEDSTRLIGYRGEALNALQTLLTTVASKNREESVKVILDIGNYKDARKKTLEELARKVEKTVKKTGKSVTLEPMNAYERKILHTELQNSEFVKTYSVGEGDRRRVVIAKK